MFRKISQSKKGKKGQKHSEDTKIKMRETRKKQAFTEETRLKMSASAKLRCERLKGNYND